MTFGWQPYVPVAKRREQAAKKIKALRKRGVEIHPVDIEGRKIAKTFWGKAWCQHIELFSDYDNRLPRGRTYVRNGSVCHLNTNQGEIEAIVSGSELYNVTGTIKPLSAKRWKNIKTTCTGHVGSILELLQGKLSDNIMAAVTDPKHGLFPQATDLDLSCDCFDWADMCKHIAAVLYGIGARLDTAPEMLFALRGVDHHELISTDLSVPTTTANRRKITGNVSDVFGIEFDEPEEQVPQTPKKRTKKKSVPKKRSSTQDKTIKPVRNGAKTKSNASTSFKPTAAAVRRLRKTLQMNKSQFATLLSVSPTTITHWERGYGKLTLKESSYEALVRASNLPITKAWKEIGFL